MAVKEKVKAFYKKASENNWTSFLIYANELKAYGVDRCVSYDPKEDCPAGSYRGFYNGTVLKHTRLCDEMTADEKNSLTSLGFGLKPQCFWCRQPDGSAWGINDCHILYLGRELTADELWLTDIKQRAIDLGYDIRDCGWIADCHIGWGFWGATITDAWNALSGFGKETGVTYAQASIIKNFAGGHLYVINSFYAYGLYGITEPIPTKLTCYDYACIAGTTVELKAKLEEGTFLARDIEGAPVEFVVTIRGITLRPTVTTDANGIAKRTFSGVWWLFFSEGVFNVTANFKGDDIHNPSSCSLALTITPPAHDTALSIAITDEAGNPITESVVGETIYIAGQLKDIVDDVALQGALITLYKNGVATSNTDITDASGIYSIPYTITKADVGIVKFKTYFAGT